MVHRPSVTLNWHRFSMQLEVSYVTALENFATSSLSLESLTLKKWSAHDFGDAPGVVVLLTDQT